MKSPHFSNIELIKEVCGKFRIPQSNTDFWQAKIKRNRERDQRNYDILLQNGWQVIVIWECQLSKEKLETTMQQVAVALNKNFLQIIRKSVAGS